MRQDYDEFRKRDTEVIVAGPESVPAFLAYWEKENLPFVGIPDPKHVILKRYGQEVKIFKLGRMPAQVLLDKQGMVRYVHYGHNMADIPSNKEILSLIDLVDQRDDPFLSPTSSDPN